MLFDAAADYPAAQGGFQARQFPHGPRGSFVRKGGACEKQPDNAAAVGCVHPRGPVRWENSGVVSSRLTPFI